MSGLGGGMMVGPRDGSTELFRVRVGDGTAWMVGGSDTAARVSAPDGVARVHDPSRFLLPVDRIDVLLPFLTSGSPVRAEFRLTLAAVDYVVVHVAGRVVPPRQLPGIATGQLRRDLTN